MKFVDYYKTLGLQDNASSADIKKAYRKLARKYHPDVSKEADSEERFKEINEANQVLKNPERRREYDELKKYGAQHGGLGAGGPQGAGNEGGFRPPPGWQSHAGFDPSGYGGGEQVDFSDFFEQIFGNRSGQHSSHHTEEHFATRGQDIRSRLSISLTDAYHGRSLPLTLQIPVYQSDGSIQTEQKTLKVTIPKGVKDGQNIRLRGQGGPGVGDGKTGDLYIELHIEDDERFHLHGRDITLHLPIAPWEAALGETVEIPTLGGKVKLTIPANAKAGQKLRLRGRGMPGKPDGDQFIVLTIVLPTVETETQKELFQSMKKLWSFNPREHAGD